jgi:hypothetical protein
MDVKNQEQTEAEEIEGIGEREEGDWGEYPIDTLLIRPETRTVHDVLRRIAKGSFIMNPDFQRDFIWPDDKQSKLIESVLMRIPLPVFYLAEDGQGRTIVVDGLQRLSTFDRFCSNRMRLKLPDQPDLHGRRFCELSTKLQNRIEDCNLVLYVIDAKVPERARLDIFERVNSGIPLTRQQMRNCLYMGPATAFLKTEAANEVFGEATGHSLKSSTMRDREFVNRFCAFQLLDVDEYRGDMDEFLAQALERMNGMSDNELSCLSAELRTALTNNLKLFGRHAFRKHQPGQVDRSIVNAALWDVMSTGLSRREEETLDEVAEHLKQAFYALLSDPDFNRSITYSPNSTAQVRLRFYAARKMFSEVFHA